MRGYPNPVTTITDLKATYKDGFAFDSKYRLELNFPAKIQSALASDKLNIVCQSIEIPKTSVRTQKIMYRGLPLTLKGQVSFDETFRISVQEQGHFQIRKAMQKWIDLCDNLDGTSSEDYMIDEVYLYHLDTKGNPTLKITFYGVFLTEIGSISLSDTSTEAIKFDCTFSFSNYEIEAV